MLDRMQLGDIARKHHVALRGPDGSLRFEECFTRDGFDGPDTIMYHLRRPHTQLVVPTPHGWTPPVAAPSETTRPLAKRHYVTPQLAAASSAATDGSALNSRTALLFNNDVISGVAFPTADDPVYVSNGDGDELIYIHRGGGTLRTMLGDVTFAQGDYVFVPRGLLHRFTLGEAKHVGEQYWFWMELSGGLHVPKQWRNDVGQLRWMHRMATAILNAQRLPVPLTKVFVTLPSRKIIAGTVLNIKMHRLMSWAGLHRVSVGVSHLEFPTTRIQRAFAADMARHVRRPRGVGL